MGGGGGLGVGYANGRSRYRGGRLDGGAYFGSMRERPRGRLYFKLVCLASGMRERWTEGLSMGGTGCAYANGAPRARRALLIHWLGWPVGVSWSFIHLVPNRRRRSRSGCHRGTPPQAATWLSSRHLEPALAIRWAEGPTWYHP
jgi:hypothetical protein